MANFDRRLVYLVLFLLGLGLVQVYSASFVFSTESFDDGLFFFRRQALFVGLGLIAMLAMAHARWSTLHIAGLIGFVLCGVLVICSLDPHFGIKVGGARRWIPLVAGFRLEPGEFLKFLLPFWMALVIAAWKGPAFGKWRWAIAVAGLVPLMALLKQPDFGSFVLCVGIGFGLAFAFGMPWRFVALGAGAIVPALYFLVIKSPYRSARLMSFLDPWSDANDSGFQLIQSMLSFYKGGLTGVGLGEGQGKLFFLPEAHNDFTIAVLGEEMGFMGIAFVLTLYGLFLMKALQISHNANDERQKIIGLGITIAFALSTFINVGVALGLVPTKGLALPFMSYGGSSLVASCLAVGVLLNIDRQTQLKTLRKRFKAL